MREHPPFGQELRTPVANLLRYVELLREGAAGELNHSQLTLLARVEGSAQQLLAMVEEVQREESLDVAEVYFGDDDVHLDAS
jgi:signal transduction histidine kinase